MGWKNLTMLIDERRAPGARDIQFFLWQIVNNAHRSKALLVEKYLIKIVSDKKHLLVIKFAISFRFTKSF